MAKTYAVFVLLCLIASCSNVKHGLVPVVEGNLSLLVKLEGLQCCDGVLRLGVYHHKDYWMSNSGMIRGRISVVVAGSQTIEIHGLPAGIYAIAVHQDVNADGRFNRSFGILPREPYGFSNDAGKYGPASFHKASFGLNQDMNISINMNNPP